jgi:uncharacterized protein YaaW (UPF0174 family)
MINNNLLHVKNLLDSASEEDRKNLQAIIGAGFGSSSELLCDHLNYLHGGFIGQLINRKSYKQLVTDVADRVKIDWPSLLNGRHWDDLGANEIEDTVVLKVFGDIYSKLSEEDKKKIAEELGKDANAPDFIYQVVTGGAMILARLSGFQIYLIATTTLAAVTSGLGIVLPFAIYTVLTSSIGIILGPIGWAGLAISTLFSLCQANYSKLLPAVIFISFLRHKIVEE